LIPSTSLQDGSRGWLAGKVIRNPVVEMTEKETCPNRARGVIKPFRVS
jgi:hypothetical protein